MLGEETAHPAVLWVFGLPGSCSCTHLDHLISGSKIIVGNCEVSLQVWTTNTPYKAQFHTLPKS